MSLNHTDILMVRISVTLKDRLRALAWSKDIAISSLVRAALEIYLTDEGASIALMDYWKSGRPREPKPKPTRSI